jgi:hypothetical protein
MVANSDEAIERIGVDFLSSAGASATQNGNSDASQRISLPKGDSIQEHEPV